MTEAQKLASYVDDHVTASRDYGPVPFNSIMAQAIAMRTMAGSRMYNEFGTWFMEFTFIDDSSITYGMDEDDIMIQI